MIRKTYFNRSVALIFIIMLIICLIPFVSSINIINQTNIGPLNTPLGVRWWPMYHNESTNDGFSDSTAPDSDDLLWSYQTDYYITSSPAILHGKVYIGSWDKKLYCFDMMTGNIIWDYPTNGKITSSPAVIEDRVYFGSQDYKFYCLNSNDGSLIWKYATDYMIESSPTVKGAYVYFGSSDGSLYCLDKEDGSYIWDYPTGNVIWSSPAVTDEYVYFGTLMGDFFCLARINRDLIWSYSTPSGIWSSPAIFNGKVYFGTNNDFVYCLEADDGDFVWKFDTGGEVHSSPAIAYGNVYIGASPRGIFCIDAETGDLVWKFLINNGVWSPPSIADGKVYYGTDPCCGAPHYFHCVDAYTGEMIWNYNTGGLLGMKSSPAIAAGKVFIGTGDGKVMAFGGNELIADAHGPYSDFVNNPVQFTGSAYGGEPDYTWYWDFGDGETSEDQNPIHIYTNIGSYDITLTVKDYYGSVSIDLTRVFIDMSANLPPNPPIIDGPTHGTIGIEYEWSFNSTDPDGDDVYYLVQWGDACGSQDFVGPYPSGEEVFLNHSYGYKGTYSIYSKAYDIYDAESDWSIFEITMPRYKILYKPLILLFLEKFPVIKQLLGI